MVKTSLVGTIKGAFDGALDGMTARLVRRRKFGYTVELLASKPPFHKGEIVDLSPAEFLLHHDRPPTLPPEDGVHRSSASQAPQGLQTNETLPTMPQAG